MSKWGAILTSWHTCTPRRVSFCPCRCASLLSVTDLHHEAGIAEQTPFYLLIEYSSGLNTGSMDLWIIYWFTVKSIYAFSVCVCTIRISVCVCVRAKFCLQAYLRKEPLSLFLTCHVCAAALTFPDESQHDCVPLRKEAAVPNVQAVPSLSLSLWLRRRYTVWAQTLWGNRILAAVRVWRKGGRRGIETQNQNRRPER